MFFFQIARPGTYLGIDQGAYGKLHPHLSNEVVPIMYLGLNKAFWTANTLWVKKLDPFLFEHNWQILSDFYRAMLCKRGLCCHAVSVRPSITFVDHVKTNKHIFEIFSLSGSDTILVFPYQRGCRQSDGSPLMGATNARGYDKMPIFFTNNSLYLRNGYS